MWQAQVEQEDIRLEAERRVKYRGTACVKLDALHFRRDELRELDRGHVEYLKQCFKKEGCRPLEVSHHIPAVIDQERLDAAILASGISAKDLLSNPQDGYPGLVFPTGYQLECLHGRHRIQAGKEFLSPRNKWWAVDLYLADTNIALKRCLIEEYSNEEKPTDGEIYRKIREYHFQRNFSFEMRWWARLKGNRTKNLKGLLGDYELTAAFDSLLDIPGLDDGMMLTTLHTMMALKYRDKILCCLYHIKDVYCKIVGADMNALREIDKNALRKIDQAAVKELELRAPYASTLDAEALRSQVLGGKILGAFNHQERETIWSNLQTIDGLIPSLFTFFKDLLWLQGIAACVKRLTKPLRDQTVSTAIENCFKGINQREGQVVVQVTETSFKFEPGNLTDRLDLGDRQIHAYAMRHVLKMPHERIKENVLMKPTVKADKTVLRGFADLAERLGYQSPEISDLKQLPNATITADSSQSMPLLVTSGPGVPRKQRCGLPNAQAHEEDCKFVFINNLHKESQEQGEGITSFFVLRSKYFAFFGRPKRTSVGDSLSSHGITPHFPEIFEHMEEEARSNQDRTDDMDIEQLEQDGPEQERLERLEQERLERLEQERLEQERLKQERLEQERLDRERLKQEMLERQHLEQEQKRLEQERLERLEQEALQQQQLKWEQEQERLKQERLERERLEQQRKRLEQERLEHLEQEALQQQQLKWEQEQERLNQERLERERLEQQRLKQEAIEQEKQQHEQEQERLRQKRATQLDLEKLIEQGLLEQKRIEQEQLEQERIELERLEHEKLERERLERLEKERIEQERLGRERLEKERLEQERLERLEQERLERLEQERLERLEHERLKQEMLERQRLEQEQKRLEQERLEHLEQEALQQQQLKWEQEQERLNQERLERERLEQQRLEQEAIEQGRRDKERQQHEQEQERLRQKRATQLDLEKLIEQGLLEQKRVEQEQQEQERIELERLEHEKLERERLERLEKERIEQERLEQERLEQERLEQERLEQEKLEQERLERLEQVKLKREREERLQKEKEDKEHKELEEKQEKARHKENRQRRDTHLDLEKLLSGDMAQSQAIAAVSQEGKAGAKPARRIMHATGAKRGATTVDELSTQKPLVETPGKQVQINFKFKERGIWRDLPPLIVDSSYPSEVERVAKKYMRKGLRLFDTKQRMLSPQECFQVVTHNGTNTILLIPQNELIIDNEALDFTTDTRTDAASDREHRSKRVQGTDSRS